MISVTQLLTSVQVNAEFLGAVSSCVAAVLFSLEVLCTFIPIVFLQAVGHSLSRFCLEKLNPSLKSVEKSP